MQETKEAKKVDVAPSVTKIVKELTDEENEFIPLDVVIDRSKLLEDNFGEDAEKLLDSLKEQNEHKRMFTFDETNLEVKLLSFEENVARQVDEFIEEMPEKLKNVMDKCDGKIPIDFIAKFSKMNTLLAKVEDREKLVSDCVKDYSRFTELDDKNLRVLTKEERIRKQVEEIFKDANYFYDEEILELSSQHEERYIAIEELIPNIKEEELTVETVASSVKDSELVECDSTNTMIRKKTPVKTKSEKLPKPLEHRIKKIVDSYFGEGLYMYDRDMHNIEQKNNGKIPLKEVVEFPRLKLILEGADISEEAILKALEDCDNVELEGEFLKQKHHDYSLRSTKSINADFSFDSPTHENSFTVMTYNILADFLCSSETGYVYASKRSKKWENRQRAVIAQIKYYEPDILCLQELQGTLNENEDDPDDHRTHIAKELAQIGYNESFVYCRKMLHDVQEQKRGPDIGNAIFFREESFELVQKKEILFAQELSAKCANDEKTQKQIEKKYPQVAIIAHLRQKKTKHDLVICTTHLSANFRSAYIQLLQLQICVDSLKEFVESINGKVAVLLCGDFNATPDHPSYEMMSLPNLSKEKIELLQKAAQKDKFFLPENTSFKSDLHMKSAYKEVAGQEPTASHVVSDFFGTLDYVWYGESLKPIAVLETPTTEVMKRNKGMPDPVFPSDHVPLLAHFEFN
jgi:mRNA deadenylase 3'-5' endonuclease subunit Ccr4